MNMVRVGKHGGLISVSPLSGGILEWIGKEWV